MNQSEPKFMAVPLAPGTMKPEGNGLGWNGKADLRGRGFEMRERVIRRGGRPLFLALFSFD